MVVHIEVKKEYYMAVLRVKGKCDTMLGLFTTEFGYQSRLRLLQQLIECDVLGRELAYGTFLLLF